MERLLWTEHQPALGATHATATPPDNKKHPALCLPGNARPGPARERANGRVGREPSPPRSEGRALQVAGCGAGAGKNKPTCPCVYS